MAQLMVAGWAMDNMKPLDFTHSSQPLLALTDEQAFTLTEFISAAEIFAIALRGALQPVLGEGEAREAVREQFYAETQAAFEQCQTRVASGEDGSSIAANWLSHMRRVASRLFHAASLPGLANRKPEKAEDILAAHDMLQFTFGGYTRSGAEAYGMLGLPLPETAKKSAKRKEPA